MLIYRKRHWVMDYLVAAGWLLAGACEKKSVKGENQGLL